METWGRWELLREHRATVARRAANQNTGAHVSLLTNSIPHISSNSEPQQHPWDKYDDEDDALESSGGSYYHSMTNATTSGSGASVAVNSLARSSSVLSQAQNQHQHFQQHHKQQHQQQLIQQRSGKRVRFVNAPDAQQPVVNRKPVVNTMKAVKTGRMKMRALDFLLHIPMDNEAEVLAGAKSHLARSQNAAQPGVNGTITGDKHGTNATNGSTATLSGDAAQGTKAHQQDPSGLPDSLLTNTDNAVRGVDQGGIEIAHGGDVTEHGVKETMAGVHPSTPTVATDETGTAAGAAGAPIGYHVRGPTNFRYVSDREARMTGQRVPRAAQEQMLLNEGIHDSARLFLSWNKGYPGMVLSVVKYSETVESRRGKKMRLGAVMMDVPRRRQEVPKILSDTDWLQREGTSYARYFNQEWAAVSGDQVDPARAAREEAWDREYQPNALDDPEVRLGKHRIVQSLDGMYLSVLPYTKKKVLKQELNEVFREQHPELPAELTLSKIRNLKREVLEHTRTLKLELSTAALAIIYFEKLVFKGVVDKRNRKLVMSVCLLLAYKFNEPKLPGTATVADVLADIERVQSLAPRQVLEAEFNVFGHLLFHLNTKTDHILTHFTRLLKSIESTPTEYLGEDLAQFYFPETDSSVDSDDESVTHIPSAIMSENTRQDNNTRLRRLIVPLPVPVPKPQHRKGQERARKAAKAFKQHLKLPKGNQ